MIDIMHTALIVSALFAWPYDACLAVASPIARQVGVEVTVLMPWYNGRPYLAATIDSVLVGLLNHRSLTQFAGFMLDGLRRGIQSTGSAAVAGRLASPLWDGSC